VKTIGCFLILAAGVCITLLGSSNNDHRAFPPLLCLFGFMICGAFGALIIEATDNSNFGMKVVGGFCVFCAGGYAGIPWRATFTHVEAPVFCAAFLLLFFLLLIISGFKLLTMSDPRLADKDEQAPGSEEGTQS
jgi:hypothetical protein